MERRWSLLLVCVALSLSPSPAAAQFRAVVLPGDPIPGRAGERVDTVREIVLLGGDAAAVVVRSTDGAAVILRDDAGAQTLVAHAGDPAPGGGSFGPLGVLYGDRDRVVFSASSGVFVWDGSTSRRVIGQTDLLPGTTRTLDALHTVTASDRGEIVVHGAGGVYYEGAGGSAPAKVLTSFDPVPGDPTFTVELIDHAEISTGGLITVSCSAMNASRSITRRYVLQGTIGALAPVASTLDTPDASGDLGLLAISRSGAIAYEYFYTTSEAGPTVSHREVWIESAGSAQRVLELIDDAPFPVDGRFMRWAATSGRLSDGMRLFVRGPTDGVTGAPSVLTVQGTEWDVVHLEDQPLPGGGVQMTNLDGASTAGEGLLSAGVVATSGLYLWSATGGLGVLARPGDVLEGSSTPISGVSGGSIGGDGRIAFAASYMEASGGLILGAFMTGESTDAETDLRAVRFEAEAVPDAGIADLVRLVLTVENAGPSPAAFEVRLVSSSAPLAEPVSCFVPIGGGCTCAGNTCTSDRAVPVRDTVEMVIAYDRTASANVVATVTPIGATELMPADNEIRVGGEPGGGSGCSVAHGARPPRPGPTVLALALLLVVRARARAAR